MPLVASIYSLCTCFFSVNYIHSIYIHLFICGTCSHISKAKPYGFDVGQSERGNVLKGLDLGVQGMRVGGQRLLIVPPSLAYGSKGVQEVPPNATIELDVELLSIKQSPFGSPVKIIEG